MAPFAPNKVKISVLKIFPKTTNSIAKTVVKLT